MSSAVDLYIGTYTSPDGSKGIYQSSLNLQTGELTSPRLVAEMQSPSFVALSPDRKHLYAINEASAGEVRAFAIETGGMLKPLNTAAFDGGGPCHVSVSADGKTVYAAAYGGGTAAAFNVLRDGSLGNQIGFYRGEGKPSRMHMLERRGKGLYACDLGTDELIQFDDDLKVRSRVRFESGTGPRHLAFHPSGKFLFVNGELSRTLVLLSLKGDKPVIEQALSTLPEGATAKGSTAEVACHPSGKFVYVSNRGHDSIAIFHFKDDRLTLSSVEKLPTKTPRSFAISADGHWLLVAGQDSDNIVSYRIDQSSGALSGPSGSLVLDKPVCVAFCPPK